MALLELNQIEFFSEKKCKSLCVLKILVVLVIYLFVSFLAVFTVQNLKNFCIKYFTLFLYTLSICFWIPYQLICAALCVEG